MRRLILASGFVVAAAALAFGQSSNFNNAIQVGGVYLTMSQSYSTSTGTQNIVLSGFGGQAFIFTGNPLGFFVSGSLAGVNSGSLGGSALDLSPYNQKLLYDILMGLDYHLPLTRQVGLTLGAGAHALGANVRSSTNQAAYLDLAYVAGIEGLVRLSYDFTNRLGLYLSSTASYDPLALVNSVFVSYQSGISYSLGIGIEFLE